MKPVRVLEEAARDIEQGRSFYDKLAAGLGGHFTDSLLDDLIRLKDFQGIHAKHFGFHRMLAGRFPFGIYYRVGSEATEVFAILDLRRDPSWIQEELTGRDR